MTQKTKKTEEYYDKNEMVYVAFDDSEKESMIPKEIAFDLRIDQISGALKVALAMFCKQCGVDEGSCHSTQNLSRRQRRL